MTELADHIIALQNTIETFINITDAPSGDLAHVFEILITNINRARPFLELLDNEEALNWMMCHYGRNIISCLIPVRGYLELLQDGWLDISWTPEQEICLHQAIEHAQYLNETTSALKQDAVNIYNMDRAESSVFVVKITPQDALAPIWSMARYNLRNTSLHLSISEQPDLASIYYSPLSTTSLLEHFFQVVGRDQSLSGVVTADLKGEDECFALSIRVQGLCMTPQLWAEIQESLFYGDNVESLREIGGRIDPLTWDEGHGQGVIIKMPWAR